MNLLTPLVVHASVAWADIHSVPHAESDFAPLLLFVVCCLLGGVLVVGGIVMVAVRWRTVERMIAVEGTVVRIDSRRASKSRTIYHFPVIEYRAVNGSTRLFSSETGDAGRTSRYVLDQTVKILYDPTEKATPLINSWWGKWSAPFFMIVGGLLFLVVALIVWPAAFPFT